MFTLLRLSSEMCSERNQVCHLGGIDVDFAIFFRQCEQSLTDANTFF